MRNINILGNLFAKDNRELTDEERRLRASLGIKLPSKIHEKPVALPPEQTQAMPNNMLQQQPFSYGNKITMPEQFKLNTPPQVKPTIKADLLNGLAPKTTGNMLITPQMQNQIDKELNIALDNKDYGTQVTDFDREKGVRTFTPNKRTVITKNEDGTHTRSEEDITPKGSVLSNNFGLNTDKKQYVPNEKNEQELRNIYKKLDKDYESGKLKFGDYLQIAAGAAADAFAIPGTGSNVMQGVLARQAASEDSSRQRFDAERNALRERAGILESRAREDKEQFYNRNRIDPTTITTVSHNGIVQNRGYNEQGQPVYMPATKSDIKSYMKDDTLSDIDIKTAELTLNKLQNNLDPSSATMDIVTENNKDVYKMRYTNPATGDFVYKPASAEQLRNFINTSKADEISLETAREQLEKMKKPLKTSISEPNTYFTSEGKQTQATWNTEIGAYVDTSGEKLENQNLLTSQDYKMVQEMTNKDATEKDNQKTLYENLKGLFRNDAVSVYGSKLFDPLFRLTSKQKSAKVLIQEAFGPLALKVVGGTTFGSLSAPELNLAETIATRLNNFNLSQDEAMLQLLAFEELTSKTLGLDEKVREKTFNRDDMRDLADQYRIDPNLSNVEIAKQVLKLNNVGISSLNSGGN